MNQAHRTDVGGFTLLEILITLFIFSVVMSTLFVAYSGTYSVIHQTSATEDAYAQARIALERICEDLGSLYTPEREEASEGDKSADGPVWFVGEAAEGGNRTFDSLRFLSLAHMDFEGTSSIAQPAEVVYYVKQDHADAPATLYRSDTLLTQERPETGTGGFPLCQGLLGVDFTYYDAQGVPHEHWDSRDMGSSQQAPSRVSVLLEFSPQTGREEPLRFRTGVALPGSRKGRNFEG